MTREQTDSVAARIFIAKARELLMTDYLPKIERCMEKLTDEAAWWRAGEHSNSVGNLILHLCGNVRQWIVGGVGGREVERDRQREFDERKQITAGELLERIKAVVAEADEVLAGLDAEALRGGRRIQDYDVDVLTAVYHVVEHFGMHYGQIVYITKLLKGEDLGFYRELNATGRL
jgi:uncharacterized damage-inducible protein DinB